MPILSETEIARILAPYLNPIPPVLPQLSAYLDLLVRWNARTNLTAIRSPKDMVRRHFGESLFVAGNLGDPLPRTLLDLGSGAGFPGVPIALAHPEITATLAESQNKKSTFLREVVRTLGLKNVEVWSGRAEALPAERQFHTVTLRAVDDMAAALKAGTSRATCQLILLTTAVPAIPENFELQSSVRVPESATGVLLRAIRKRVFHVEHSSGF